MMSFYRCHFTHVTVVLRISKTLCSSSAKLWFQSLNRRAESRNLGHTFWPTLYCQLTAEGSDVLPPSSMAPPRQFLRSKHALLSLWFHLSYNVLIQGSPTGFYTGNWSILYAVWHISFYFYYDICQTVSTESCKIIPAKFRELSLNFQKLADWLCMGWPRCLAALRHAISVTLE